MHHGTPIFGDAAGYRQREQQRREATAARSAERRAATEARRAERQARTGTTTTAAPQAGLNYHTEMHAVGLRFPAVVDRWRQVGLAILDSATPEELAAQLTGSSTTSTTRGTSVRQSHTLDPMHGDNWQYVGYSQPPPGHPWHNPECWTDADQDIADAIREEEQQ